MNAAYPILFAVSGALMLGLILYGRMRAKKMPAHGQPIQTTTPTSTGESSMNTLQHQTSQKKGLRSRLSASGKAGETAAVHTQAPDGQPLRISKSSTLVDFDRFHEGFALTKQGDLVSILEILPAMVSTATNLDAFGLGFARVVHALEANTRLQVVQMPVPNNISGLLDQYALKSNHWKAQAVDSEFNGDRAAQERQARLAAITKLTGYHIIETCARSARRASFVILTENATNLGALTDKSVQRAREKLLAKTEQVRSLFLNNGILVHALDEGQAMELLWYAYNPDSGAAALSRQLAARFSEIAETGSTQYASDAAISPRQLEKALTEEGAAAEVLAPQYLEPEEAHVRFNGKRMVFYYVHDYAYSLPRINDLLGTHNEYGDRLWVSFYITAPKIEEIVQATRKASTGKQAWQELRARSGMLNSYVEDRQVQSLEVSREGSETQENIPRLISLYLGLMVDDKAEAIENDLVTFESILKSRGLEYSRVRFSTLEAWQTIIPLGQRHLHYSQMPDRNIFAEDILPLNPITTTSLIEPDGIFTGYTALGDGSLAPVSLRRKRGDHATADGAYRSPSDAFVGLPGSGKSYALKFMIAQWQAMGHRTVIIEPKPEFKPLVDLFGGEVIDIAGKGGFNIFNFAKLPGMESAKYAQYGKIVFGDNLAALVTLYGAAKNARVTGEEISLLTAALQGTLAERGMDSKDPATWGKAEIFVRDVYNHLAHNLRDRNPEAIRFMLNVLEQYGTAAGQYFESYNTPTAFNLGADLTLMSFGITQFSQDITAKALSYHFALRVAFQSAVRAFLVDKETRPVHIVIDEASQMLINGEIVSSVVEMLSLLNTYNISVHLAFQDMGAIANADALVVGGQTRSTNTLAGLLSTFYLFKQTAESAAVAMRMLDLPQTVAGGITNLRTGQCLLAFAGTTTHIPLSILVPDQLKELFDTRPEAQKARLEAEYA